MSIASFLPAVKKTITSPTLFSATAVILIMASTVPAQGTLTLSGTVATKDGVVIASGVTIFLETGEGMQVAQQSPDAAGQFSFQALRASDYKLVVTCKGFQTYTREVQLSFGADVYNVNVFLTPKNVKYAVKSPPLLSDENASKKSVKYLERGKRAFQKRKLIDAQKFFEKAVAGSPCYARAWGEMALVDVESTQLKAAETHFRRAIHCDGLYLDGYAGLAELYKDEKRYPDAEDVLQLGIQRSPTTWQLYDRLGLIHFTMKQYGKSEQDFLKVFSLNPGAPPDVDAHLANAYLKEGKYNQAYREMMKYMKAAPNGRFAPSIKKVVRLMERRKLVSPN